MSASQVVIHSGWMKKGYLEEKRPQVSRVSSGSMKYLEVEPLVMECGPEQLAEEDWMRIEKWIRKWAPYPGQRLQVLITICTCSRQAIRPLQLRLEDEKAGISWRQRSRVSLQHHNHDEQPVRLEIVLRQIVRLA